MKLYGKAGEAAEELILETTLNEAKQLEVYGNRSSEVQKMVQLIRTTDRGDAAARIYGGKQLSKTAKSFVTKLTNTHTLKDQGYS